jgi:mRNA-degrading endonuclease RelE of RelBE toxin-antitoxin system
MASAYRLLQRLRSSEAFAGSRENIRMSRPVINEMIAVLEIDPLNTSRRHNIKKLTNVEEGEGQWRIRSGVYRLRYDIVAHDVIL